MIRCSLQRDWFDASGREAWVEPWGPTSTPRNLAPAALVGSPGLVCYRNGGRIAEDDWDEQCAPEDGLHYAVEPGFEPFSAALSTLFNIEFVGLEFFGAPIAAAKAGTAAASALQLTAFIGNLSFALAVSSFLGKLIEGKPAGPGDQDSPTYGFGGIQSNPTTAGSALPSIYGEHPIAGPIINIYTRTTSDPAETFLFILMALAGHEVEAIGDKTADGGPFTSENGDLPTGLQIDNQPAENFDEVEAHVRMGSANQAKIPGFAQASLQTSIQQALDESALPATVEATPGSFAASDPNITKWDEVVAHTAAADADNFIAHLRLGGGLFDISGVSGALIPLAVRWQVRYREAPGGVPTGNYVVLPPFVDVFAAKRNAFEVEATREFIDPATFVAPVAGFFGDFTPSSTAHGATASTELTPPVADDKVDVTMMCWLKPEVTIEPSLGTVTFEDTYSLFGHADASNRGFRFSLAVNPLTDQDVIFRLEGGDGTAVQTFTGLSGTLGFHLATQARALAAVPSQPVDAEGFTLLTVTYEAAALPTGNGQILFYFNSTLVTGFEVPSTFRPIWSTSAPVIVGATSTAGANSLNGALDEVLIYKRVLGLVEITSKYNGGFPQQTQPGELGLLAGWHLDSETASVTDDFVGSNDLTLAGSAVISTGSAVGPVEGSASGTPKKARYLIEWQRINAISAFPFAQDAATIEAITLITDDEFEYPGIALLAVRIKATGQLSGGQPLVRQLVKGAKCPVWDGLDPVFPTFAFRFTQNPAWIALHAATNSDVGPAPFSITTSPVTVDLQAFLDFADFCDELVYDGQGKKNGQAFVAIQLSSVADPVSFPRGMIKFQVLQSDWPDTWPDVLAAKPPGINGHDFYFAADGDFTGAPSWLSDEEDLGLQVGEIVFITASSTYDIRLNPTDDPGLDATHSPADKTLIKVEQRERRMRFDGVADRTDFSFWDWMLLVFKSARGTPIKKGGTLSAFFDAARSVSSVIGMGNMVAGSFVTRYSGLSDRPNVIEAQFLDKSQNYDPQPAVFEHPEVNDPSKSVKRRPEQLRLEGVVRRSQVLRHAVYRLNFYFLVRRLIEWQAGPDSLASQPGDRVSASHDVPEWGESGRLQKVSTVKTEVFLDREVTLVTGKTYEIVLRDNATGAIETRATTAAPGVYAAGDVITVAAFSWIPQYREWFAFGETALAIRDFSVLSLELDPQTFTRTMKAHEYNALIYADGFGDLPDTDLSAQPPRGSGDMPDPPSELTVGDETQINADGSVSILASLQWRQPATTTEAPATTAIWLADELGKGAQLVAQLDGGANSFRIPSVYLEHDRIYTAIVQSVSHSGSAHRLGACPSAQFRARGVTVNLAALTSLAAAMSGTRLLLAWDQLAKARSIEFRQGGWILGTKLGVVPGGDSLFSTDRWATAKTNAEGVGTPTIHGRGMTGLGHYGDIASVDFAAGVIDADTALIDVAEEDGIISAWDDGTKVNLTTDEDASAGSGKAEQLPIAQRGTFLKFTGSSLTGSFEAIQASFDEPRWVYVEVDVVCDQVHPLCIKDFPYELGSLEAQRWTFEGPTHTLPGDEFPNSSIKIEIEQSLTTTIGSGTKRELVPGLYYFRRANVKVSITRPDSSYDCKLRRMAIRFTPAFVDYHPSIALRTTGNKNFSGSDVDMLWEAQDVIDSEAFTHSIVSDTEKVTVKQRSLCLVSYAIDCDPTALGTATARVQKDSGGGFSEIIGSTAYASIQNASRRGTVKYSEPILLEAGDILKVTCIRFVAGEFAALASSKFSIVQLRRM